MFKPSRIAGPICILMALFLLYGCGSSTKESAGEGSTATGGQAAVSDNALALGPVTTFSSPPSEDTLLSGTAKAGTAKCASCHSTTGSVINAFNKPGKIRKAAETDVGWINGRHGNSNNSPALLGLEDSCKKCHDPMGDGPTIESSGNTALGTTNRPVVSCEACHGGGSNHRAAGGSVAPPVDNPNALRCGRCHSSAMPSFHFTTKPEAEKVYDKYIQSKHASSINASDYVTGSKTDVQATCSRCHTDEGAKTHIATVNGLATYSEIKTALDTRDAVKNASVVQCRTCHDKHNPNRLLSKKASGLPAGWTDEFVTCTSCHQLLKADGTRQDQAYHAPYDSAGTAVNAQYGLSLGGITATHYDDPATDNIEGYVVNSAGDHDFCSGTSISDGGVNKCGTCRDCHNPHQPDKTINTQWARSAHGGGLLTVKETAIAADPKTLYSAAASDVVKSAAWVHYDFKGADRQACQKCHTASGARNYLNSLIAGTTYDQTKNVFVATAGTKQREMLYCWACHTSNTSAIRNPGPVKAAYTDNLAEYTFPDISGSNLCLLCHTGRENGDSIAKKVGDFSNLSFINSHYLTGGGTVFTVTGYEYTGLDYTNPSSYMHDKIGLSTAPVSGTGTNGPCAGCHMSSSEKHLFMPVAKDSGGTITSVTSTVCAKCHGSAMTAAALVEQETLLEEALEALSVQLQQRGFYFYNAHPYFYTAAYVAGGTNTAQKNWLSTGDSDKTGATTGKKNMGAAFNYNLLEHDPGAYAHNRYYAKRLIYDSIDWLDDNIINNSVSATLDSATHAGKTYQAGAKSYILSGDTQNPRP